MGKLIYVCSPYSGDIEGNTIKAQSYSRYVVEQGHFPIAPHLLLPQFMDEETERETAIELNYNLIDRVDELWVFGEDTTEGMLDEISYATTKGIPTINQPIDVISSMSSGDIYSKEYKIYTEDKPFYGVIGEIPKELDPINHPIHYNQGNIQPIDVIEDWELGYHLANVIKYIARCEFKGKKLEDLKKANWYLERYLANEIIKDGERYCEEIDG